MLRAFSVLSAVAALVAIAPCAFADEAAPTAPAPAQAATPAAPMPPPAATVVGDCGCCPSASTCCPPRDRCRPGRLEIQAGVSLLRPDPEGPVSAPNPAVTDAAFWDVVDYGPAISGRVAWTFAAGDWDITAAGTFWGRWDEDETLTNARLSSSAVPGGGLGTTVFPTILLHSEAMLWDVNLFATKPFYCTPCFTAAWGGGLRYLRFDEESSFTFDTPSRTEGADIDNGLLAAEGVIEGTWKLSSRWDFFARVSAFAGWRHTSGEVTFTNSFFAAPLLDPERSKDSLGYGGEIELALRWHMNSCWTFSVGYDFLALGEVSRAYKAVDNERFGTNDLGPLLSDDWITVHRVYLGVVFDL